MKDASDKKAYFLFWGLFALLNMILFLPNFITYYEISTWYPSTTVPTGTLLQKFRIFFIRNNHDFFRIAGDFLLLLFLLYLFKNNGRYQKTIAFVLVVAYLLLFYYNVYFEFYQKIYGVEPYFANDFVLLREVLPIFLREVTLGSSIPYFLALTGFALLSWLLIFLVRIMIRNFQLVRSSKWMKLLFLLIGAFTIFSTVKFYPSTSNPHWPTVQWISPRLWNSMHLENADNLQVIEKEDVYKAWLKLDLNEKPDIYLIFLESYGTVATLAPDLKENYEKLASTLEDTLSKDGWFTASAYSISPVKGGRSWLAFTSTMSGLKIDNQLQYNDMLNIHYEFPHLVRYLNRQGYETFRLSTMSNTNTDSLIPYELINRYWGFDHWVKHNDIPYQGYVYDELSGIPDQYALGYFRDEIAVDRRNPVFLFFIGMSTHGPWYPAPPLVDNWRTLDQIKAHPNGKPLGLEGEIIDRYEASMAYELKMVAQFIKEKAGNNSIFLLLGDHQPPTLEYLIWDYSDDAATPLHIISRDAAFVESFLEHHFQRGLSIDHSDKKYLQHQGLYSLLMHQLIRRYGDEGARLPEYFPNGLE